MCNKRTRVWHCTGLLLWVKF